MRKRIGWIYCLIWMFLFLFGMNAAAQNDRKVVDMAGLLSVKEQNRLEEMLKEIAAEHQLDVIAATSDTCGNQTLQTYTDDFYYENDYGYGSSRDGIILMICMEERQFHLATRGKAVSVFTDYGLKYIDEQITPELSKGNYYDAFYHFGMLAEEFIEEYENNGKAYDVDHTYSEKMGFGLRLLISSGIGLLVALLVIFVLLHQLKSVAPEQRAHEYVRNGSFRVTRCRDIFLYRTVVRRKLEKETHMGDGGSSTHRTSDGGKAGGRTGSF